MHKSSEAIIFADSSSLIAMEICVDSERVIAMDMCEDSERDTPAIEVDGF